MKRFLVLLLLAILITTLTWFLPGCDTLVTEQTTVVQAVRARFSAQPDTGCAPLTVKFDETSDGNPDSFYWNFGDGTESTVRDPEHTYDSAGIYNVTLTVVDKEKGFEDSEYKKRLIIVGTSVSDFVIDTDTVGCPGLEVTFTPTEYANVTSWQWNFGDGSTNSFDSVVTHVYNTPGFYTVTLTATGSCGTKVITKDSLIHIENCPVVTIGKDSTEGCTGLAVTFWDSTQIDTPFVFINRLWNFGDTTDTGPNPTITFDSAGIYEISLTVTTDGGTAVGYDTITIYGIPEPGFMALSPQTTCKSDFQQFIVKFADTSHGSITSRVWYFGDGDSLVGDSVPVHAYIEPGEYTVSLKVAGPCGEGETSIDKFVTLYDSLSLFDSLGAPKYSITPDSGSLLDTFTFYHFPSATDIIANRIWTFGDSFPASSDTLIERTYADTGHYEISLFISNDCNSVQIIDTIIVTDTISR